MRLGAKLAAAAGLITGLGVWRAAGGSWPWKHESPQERVANAINEVLSQSDSADLVDWDEEAA